MNQKHLSGFGPMRGPTVTAAVDAAVTTTAAAATAATAAFE